MNKIKFIPGNRAGFREDPDKSGIIEVRPGTKGVDLGDKKYEVAYIRVLDEYHYIKGMCIYSDNLPDDYDVMLYYDDPRNALYALHRVRSDLKLKNGVMTPIIETIPEDQLFFQDQKPTNKIRIRAVVDIPVTDEELYDLCVKSNGEGELDTIGCGYSEIQLTPEQVREYFTREWAPSEDKNDQSWICEDDLEKYDMWFLEKKKEKYGRYDRDPFTGA